MRTYTDFAGAQALRAALAAGCSVVALLVCCAGAIAQSNPPSSAGSAAPSTAKPERRFEISAFDVAGNTVLDEEAIDAALEPYLGPDRVMSDIEAARAALEKAYAARGFQTVYVTIPKQTVRGGLVKLEAVETKIGEVTLKGQKWSSPRQITQALPTLKPGSVPNLNKLNGELVALNSQSADRQVTPQMTQGKAAGTIDVDLDVQDKLALHGGLEINNRYSRDTHQYRLQANASYDDLWHLGHSISGFYSVVPEKRDDGEVYALTYSAPLPGSDVKLSLTGLKSNSNVTTLGSTNVLGKGESLTLAATLPLGTLGNYFHYVQGSVAYKHFNDTISLGSTKDSAPITYYPISVSYVGSWQDGLNQISLNSALTFSFRGLGSGQKAFDTTRAYADGDFVYARAGLSWLRNLPYGFTAYGEAGGQISNGALISNEQYSIGGDGSVRGYLQSEGLGDKGLRGSLELRSPSLAPYLHIAALNELKLFTFFDGAKAWLSSPLPEQQAVYSLRSTGVGTSLQLFDRLNASVAAAWPLKATAGNGLSGSSYYGKERIQFRVWTQF